VISKVVGDFRGWDQGVEKYRLSFERLLGKLCTSVSVVI